MTTYYHNSARSTNKCEGFWLWDITFGDGEPPDESEVKGEPLFRVDFAPRFGFEPFRY
jgi:hypothetical protein